MSDTALKQKIQTSIQNFITKEFFLAADDLLKTMGYDSERRMPLADKTADDFFETFSQPVSINKEKAQVSDWLKIDLLFQLADEDLDLYSQRQIPLVVDKSINPSITSYLFFALELKDKDYSRTQLSTITREINKLFSVPAMLVFNYGEKISVAIIGRRPNMHETGKDVLEKVTLIKDISMRSPHRAHVEILHDLALSQLNSGKALANMEALHKEWQRVLDIKELNKNFYRELSYWYFWAVKECTFPAEAGSDETRNPTSVIRLITRLIFIWFIKEKGLVPDALFEKDTISEVLKSLQDEETTYYKAILQNLFFAVLNQEDVSKRQFIEDASFQGKSSQYGVANVFRYKDLFVEPTTTLQLFKDIPFLNGGLFECLDRERDAGEAVPAGCEEKMRRVDGFSGNPANPINVPNKLFFGAERGVDLNAVFDTKNKTYKVSGLINILNRYKFTVEENTPLEEEVALDPELLGRVFENLLAAYNPETQTTARKATGSYYTPREIVNYMVDESLLAYLDQKLKEFNPDPQVEALKPSQPTLSGEHQPGLPSETRTDAQTSPYEIRLRHLFSYTEHGNPFDRKETQVLLDAIDTVKVLDPACGSGAFPMGVLHRLVFLLGKLDEDNAQWKKRQLDKLAGISGGIDQARTVWCAVDYQ